MWVDAFVSLAPTWNYNLQLLLPPHNHSGLWYSDLWAIGKPDSLFDVVSAADWGKSAQTQLSMLFQSRFMSYQAFHQNKILQKNQLPNWICISAFLTDSRLFFNSTKFREPYRQKSQRDNGLMKSSTWPVVTK